MVADRLSAASSGWLASPFPEMVYYTQPAKPLTAALLCLLYLQRSREQARLHFKYKSPCNRKGFLLRREGDWLRLSWKWFITHNPQSL